MLPLERNAAMSLETWFAFTAAAAVLLVIPGPTILLVVSYALGQGWRTAVPMAVGVALGDFTAMTLSMLGIGALLLASATVFMVLKLQAPPTLSTSASSCSAPATYCGPNRARRAARHSGWRRMPGSSPP
jgi:hypothetical protein